MIEIKKKANLKEQKSMAIVIVAQREVAKLIYTR